jgi:hypothetical protein
MTGRCYTIGYIKKPLPKKMEGAFVLRCGPDPPIYWGQARLELVPKYLGDDRQVIHLTSY